MKIRKTEEIEVELLPCPHCGVKDSQLDLCHDYSITWIGCNVCGSRGPTDDQTDLEAAMLWNERTNQPKPNPNPAECEHEFGESGLFIGGGGLTVDRETCEKCGAARFNAHIRTGMYSGGGICRTWVMLCPPNF